MKTNKIYTVALAALASVAAMAQTDAAAANAQQQQMVEVGLDREVPFSAYTGSVATVTAEQISYWEGTSLPDALVGLLAGYYPDKETVRGLSSPNGTAMLVVLDGIPSPSLALSQIDPKSVERVTVLKDAAAKALYGPLGAQGVILVTTKKGHNGKTVVNASANFGWQQPTEHADLLGSYEYATLRNQALLNDGLTPLYTPAQLAAYADGTGVDNDWRAKYMRDFRPQQIYNINLGGGNDRTKFFVNAGFSHRGSYYKADFKEKYNPENIANQFTLNSNVQVKMFNYLTMSAATNVRIDIEQQSCSNADNALIKRLFYTPPTIGEYVDEEGHIIVDEMLGNSIYGDINYKGVSKVTTTDINAKFALDLDMSFLTQGLTATAAVGYNSYYAGTRTGTYDYSRWVIGADGSLNRFGTNTDDPLKWGKGSSMTYFMSFQARVQYQRTFGRHAVDAFVTYLSEDRLGSSTSAAWLLPFNRIQVGGHAKYGFDNRYFLQFDCTYAGNEQMREGNQFHFSPTGSLAWVVSNEQFMRSASWLNLLKLRASFGKLQYDILATLPSRYLYSSEFRGAKSGGIQEIYTFASIAEGVIGNPDIQFEKSYQQNYGFDLEVLDRSLSLSVDYWRTNQRGIVLQDKRVPLISGISQSHMPYENIGKLFAEGVDVDIKYHKQLACGLGITAGANFAWNRNKMLDGAETNYEALKYAYPLRTTGYSIGQQFGYLIDYSQGNGYYNSQAEIDASGLRYTGVAPRVGDFRYQDLNGDGVIDNADLAPLEGVKTMPSCNYGASLQLTFKGFDFYTLLQAQTGRSALYSGMGVWENVQQGLYVDMHRHACTAERYAAGQEISYPALTSTTSSSLQANDFFVSKADYLRLKNVTLGYSLPKHISGKAGFSKIRVYFTAQNLLTATNLKFKGIDPENKNIAQINNRSYNFGLDLTF